MNITQLRDIILQNVTLPDSIMSLSEKDFSSLQLSDDLGICSYDMMVILVRIEKECDHEIDAMKICINMTVMDLLNLINKEE